MIRPIIEYASTIWTPHLQKDILKLESIQRMVRYRSNATSHSLETFCSTHARTRRLPSRFFKFAA